MAAIIPADKTEREIYADKIDELYRAGVKITAPAIIRISPTVSMLTPLTRRFVA